MSLLLRVAPALVSSLVLACAAAPQVKPTLAPNPAAGGEAAMAVTRPSDGTLAGMTPADCSVWPIDDEYRLRLRGERLCTSAVIALPVPASAERSQSLALLGEGAGTTRGGYEEVIALHDGSMNFLLNSDTGPSASQVTLQRSGQARKFGECLDRTGRLYGVWRQEYEHCAPAAALLTPSTRRFALQRPAPFGGSRDVVVWHFE